MTESSSDPFSESLLELARLAGELAVPLADPVREAADLMFDALASGGKVLCAGNGGSAADAQHFAAELVGRMGRERKALAALSLSSDPSVVTALANDYGYENLFERQVQALGRPGDVLLAISTSGTSRNVIKAFDAARALGMGCVAMVGTNTETPLSGADVFMSIPAPNTQRVQEIHGAILHGICDRVERRVTGEIQPDTGP